MKALLNKSERFIEIRTTAQDNTLRSTEPFTATEYTDRTDSLARFAHRLSRRHASDRRAKEAETTV
jgi:hypothetical protein